MNLDGQTYESLTGNFTWQIPERYNIGVDVCDKWADGSGRLALIYEERDGSATRYSFDDLKAPLQPVRQRAAPQRRRCKATAWHLPAAIARNRHRASGRLQGRHASRCPSSRCSASTRSSTGSPTAPRRHSSPTRQVCKKLAEIRHTLPELKAVYCVDVDSDSTTSKPAARMPSGTRSTPSPTAFTPVDTHRKIPPSSSTPPAPPANRKARLHAQRVLLGHLPGVELSQAVLSRARQADLDAGRLGVDRRSLRRPAARVASRRDRARAPLRQNSTARPHST